MEKAEVMEAPESALEVVGDQNLNQSSYDAIIKFSEQTEKIGKALDSTRKFMLNRACNGDFITHNGKTVNVNGPGSERILSALGLMGVAWSLTDWKKYKDEGHDANGAWFTWWYSAEATLGNMKLGRIEGRASSRDKFFGFKDKKWKDLADVKEPDIQMAARRCVYKELVKIGLGMRNIPIEDAVAMGLQKEKIAKVEFGSEGETKVEAAPAGTSVLLTKVNRFKGTYKSGKNVGKDYVKYYLTDDKGAKYATFDEKIALSADKWVSFKTPVVIQYEVSKFGNDIKSIAEAPKAEAPAAGDAQDDQDEPKA
jgi:hypothetical protein